MLPDVETYEDLRLTCSIPGQGHRLRAPRRVSHTSGNRQFMPPQPDRVQTVSRISGSVRPECTTGNRLPVQAGAMVVEPGCTTACLMRPGTAASVKTRFCYLPSAIPNPFDPDKAAGSSAVPVPQKRDLIVSKKDIWIRFVISPFAFPGLVSLICFDSCERLKRPWWTVRSNIECCRRQDNSTGTGRLESLDLVQCLEKGPLEIALVSGYLVQDLGLPKWVLRMHYGQTQKLFEMIEVSISM